MVCLGLWFACGLYCCGSVSWGGCGLGGVCRGLGGVCCGWGLWSRWVLKSFSVCLLSCSLVVVCFLVWSVFGMSLGMFSVWFRYAFGMPSRGLSKVVGFVPKDSDGMMRWGLFGFVSAMFPKPRALTLGWSTTSGDTLAMS